LRLRKRTAPCCGSKTLFFLSALACAKAAYGADAQALVQEALELDPDNKVAQRAQERLEQGKSVSANTMRQLVEMNEARIKESDRAKNENTAPASEAVNKTDAREVVAKLQSSIADLEGMQPVAELKGTEFPKGPKKLTEQVGDFFRSIGNAVFRRGLGNVVLDERGVKSDIAHGIGRAKAITFAAVPDVIASGQEIDAQKNWKGRGYDTYVYAAPVTLAGKTTYVAAVVRSGENNRFYLHEVVDGEGNLIYKIEEDPAAIKTGVTTDEGGITGTAGSSAPTIAQGGGRVNSGEQMGNAGRAIYDTVRSMAPEMDEVSYRTQFRLAYEIGRQTAGADETRGLALAQERLADMELPANVAEAAFYAGREDMHYENQQRGAEHHEQETGIPVRDGEQRADGADQSGQGSRVAENAGRAEARRGRRGGAADSGAADVRLAGEVRSSADLIGRRGSRRDKLRLVTGGYSPAMEKARQQARARGLTVYFYTGDYMTVDGEKCRGFITGNTVYLRADDPHYTADQIMRHEAGHDAIRRGEIDLQEVWDSLEAKYGTEGLHNILRAYAEDYAGSGMSADELWEEIVCDSLGEMNVFSTDLRAVAPELAELLEDVQGETLRNAYSRQGQNNTAAQEGGGKMSRVGRDGSLRTLEERVQGDALLDAQDLIETVRSVGGEVDENGYITLYHRTSAENAARIKETGYMQGKEDGLFFSTEENGQNEGYGNTAVKFSIPAEMVTLDDIFSSEAHLRLPMDKPGKMYIGKYLVKETNNRYSYANLTAKPDMVLTVIDDTQSHEATPAGRKAVVNTAIENAKKVGHTNEQGDVVVHVKDTGTDVILSKAALRHGLDRRFQINAPATLQAGKILANSIRINELTPVKPTAETSYVLIGAAKNKNNESYIVRFVVNRYSNEVTSVDVLYATNAKTEPAGSLSPELTGRPAALTGSTISISSLLDYVNKYFPDVLPMDVLQHYGYESRPAGKLGESAKFSRVTESMETLQAENTALRGQVKEFQRALRATERKLADARESRDNWRNKATFRPERVGRDIIRAYEGTVGESEIHADVKKLIDYAARKDGITYEQMKELAAPVAARVVQSAATLQNGEAAQTWANLKTHLRGGRMKVSQAAINDIDGWGDFWRRNGRRLNLVTGKDGTPVDVAYAELREKFGNAYFPEEITHPADQLRRLAEVYDNLQPVFENPYSLHMALAAEHCANDLVDMVMGEVARGRT